MIVAVVPAYNEENKIGSVVRDLFRIVDNVIVVDDGSEDNTFEEAQKAGAFTVRHTINRGQGAALQTGHEIARQMDISFLVHFDGDGQFFVDDINDALGKLRESGADVLFGSRFSGVDSKIPFLKKFFILPVARVVNIFFGTPNLKDAHNGFRIFNKKAVEIIVITQDRMAHATEIPVLVQKNKLNFVEHPIRVRYDEYGQGFLTGLKIVFDLFLAKFIK